MQFPALEGHIYGALLRKFSGVRTDPGPKSQFEEDFKVWGRNPVENCKDHQALRVYVQAEKTKTLRSIV